MVAPKFKKFFISLLFFSLAIGHVVFGQDVQDFTVTDTDGNVHSLYADYLDEDRVVVIKLYWAGCPPCNATAKDVQDLYVKWEEGQGKVEFIALGTQGFEGDEDARGYIGRHGITFPMVSPDGNSLEAIDQFNFFGTPTYIIALPDRSMIFDPGRLPEVDAAISTAVNTAQAPECPTTPLRITSNQDLVNYQNQYPTCTELNGNLTIDGSISNLKGLEDIERINGSLLISGEGLIDLSDLVALNSVTGDIRILESPNLTSLTGLETITDFNGSIELQDLPVLNSIDGLRNMRSIGDNLIIQECHALQNLVGLRNLLNISSNLSIINNNNLSSLTGLESLRRVDEKLTIRSNSRLSSITGIEDLNLFGAIDIIDNPRLANCAISSICGLLGGDLAIPTNISGNATGCEDLEAVNNACNPVTQTTAFAIQVLDAFDKPVEGIKLIARTQSGESGNTLLGTTDPDGVFSFELPNETITSFDDNIFLAYQEPDDAFVTGVSVTDLVRIQRHILGLELISNPYALIAADANGNGSISATDLVFMINVILGRRSGFVNNQVFRIVTEDCTLGNSNCDSVELIENPGNSNQIMLRAIKVGDIR